MQKICTKIYHDFISEEQNSSATTVSFLYIWGPGEPEKPCGLGELWGPGSHGGQRGQGKSPEGSHGGHGGQGSHGAREKLWQGSQVNHGSYVTGAMGAREARIATGAMEARGATGARETRGAMETRGATRAREVRGVMGTTKARGASRSSIPQLGPSLSCKQQCCGNEKSCQHVILLKA